MELRRPPTPVSLLRGSNHRAEPNSTPIRCRVGQQNNQPNRLSPYRAKNMPNPITTTVPKSRGALTPRLTCVNHAHVQAQFRIFIEDQRMDYCSRCAAHLASNGFNVQPISPQKRQEGKGGRRTELSAFLGELLKVENAYREKGEALGNVEASFEAEQQTIDNFYASMLEYIEYIRGEHLAFLEEESQRCRQTCRIEADQIEETLGEMRVMREDIEDNFEKIVSEVDGQSYAQCLHYYQQQRGIHQHRLQQLGNENLPMPCTTAHIVEDRLSRFKQFIDQTSGLLSSQAESARSSHMMNQ